MPISKFMENCQKILSGKEFREIERTCLFDINGGTAFTVEGNQVRNIITDDFIGGGNWMAHTFVPKGEYWLERSICLEDEREIFYLLVHEISECTIMSRHELGYQKAHQIANILEAAARKCDIPKLGAASVQGLRNIFLDASECEFDEKTDGKCKEFLGSGFGEWLRKTGESVKENVLCKGNLMEEKVEKKYHVAPSPVHGWGAFSSKDLQKGEFIGLGFIFVNDSGDLDDDYEMTDLARGINHDADPNTTISKEHGNYYFRAKKSIKEAKELLVDYSNVPFKDFKEFLEKTKKGQKKDAAEFQKEMKSKATA